MDSGACDHLGASGASARVISFVRTLAPADTDGITFGVPRLTQGDDDAVAWDDFNHIVSVRITRIALASAAAVATTKQQPRIAAVELESLVGPSRHSVGRFTVGVVSEGPNAESRLFGPHDSAPDATVGHHSPELRVNLRFDCDGHTRLVCSGNAPVELSGEILIGRLGQEAIMDMDAMDDGVVDVTNGDGLDAIFRSMGAGAGGDGDGAGGGGGDGQGAPSDFQAMLMELLSGMQRGGPQVDALRGGANANSRRRLNRGRRSQ